LQKEIKQEQINKENAQQSENESQPSEKSGMKKRPLAYKQTNNTKPATIKKVT